MKIIHNKFEKIVVSDSALPLVSNCILEEENAIHEWKMMSRICNRNAKSLRVMERGGIWEIL